MNLEKEETVIEAVGLATQSIWLGETSLVMAGGMESMTNAPYILPQARSGLRLGHGNAPRTNDVEENHQFAGG